MLLFIALSIIIGSGFILFRSQLTPLIRGFISLMIKDISKTPEGAEMIYDKAIDEAQDEFNQASHTHKQIYDTLRQEVMKLEDQQKRLKYIEQKCESLVRGGHLEQAKLSAIEREDVLKEIDFINNHVESLKKAESQAREVVDLFREKLHNLKREKNQLVNELIVGQKLTDAFTKLDGLKKGSTDNSLLDAVKDGAQETTARAISARVAHESKISTKVGNLDEKISSLDSDNYLESVRRKIEDERKDSSNTVKLENYKNKRKI